MGNGGMKKVLLYSVVIFMDCRVDEALTHLWQVLDANWGFARQRIKGSKVIHRKVSCIEYAFLPPEYI